MTDGKELIVPFNQEKRIESHGICSTEPLLPLLPEDNKKCTKGTAHSDLKGFDEEITVGCSDSSSVGSNDAVVQSKNVVQGFKPVNVSRCTFTDEGQPCPMPFVEIRMRACSRCPSMKGDVSVMTFDSFSHCSSEGYTSRGRGEFSPVDEASALPVTGSFEAENFRRSWLGTRHDC